MIQAMNPKLPIGTVRFPAGFVNSFDSVKGPRR
jgi:hypothetical protein